MNFVLLLLYIVLQDGKPVAKLEQVPAKTAEACVIAGQQRIEELQDNPNFIDGLFAKCVQLPTVEVKK